LPNDKQHCKVPSSLSCDTNLKYNPQRKVFITRKGTLYQKSILPLRVNIQLGRKFILPYSDRKGQGIWGYFTCARTKNKKILKICEKKE
jgi:hypothetical protein